MDIELLSFNERSKKSSAVGNVSDISLTYQISAFYLEINPTGNLILLLLKIFTLGVLSLFECWFIKIQKLKYKESTTPQFLLIETIMVKDALYPPKIVPCYFEGLEIFFEFQYVKYRISPQGSIRKVEYIEGGDEKGLTSSQAAERLKLYGENVLDIKQKSAQEIIYQDILTPFNVFQLFSIIVWILDDYIFYSILLFLFTLYQTICSLIDIRAQLKRIRSLISQEYDALVVRDEQIIRISSAYIVPSDIVVIEKQQTLSFDGVLLSGTLTVDESLLTGESHPVLKAKNHKVLAGSVCLDCDEAQVLVINTNFNTFKGMLIRQMLANNLQGSRFNKESIKYIYFLAQIGIAQTLFSFYLLLQHSKDLYGSLIQALQIITIIIPPALPTCLKAGQDHTISMLNRKGITCLKPEMVYWGGLVDVVAFDKTGTLTKKKLKLIGVTENEMICAIFEIQNIITRYGLKVCHQLGFYNEKKIKGDPLDVAIYKAMSGYKLDYSIEKIFPFEANSQRMSIIVKIKEEYYYFTKGAPQRIFQKCRFHAGGIPDLSTFQKAGYRVLALAFKKLQHPDEKEIDENLVYLGSLCFQNDLRPSAMQCVQSLKASQIKTIMVTGDDIHTASRVAQQCCIISEQFQVLDSIMKLEEQLRDQSAFRGEIAITGEVLEFIIMNYPKQLLQSIIKAGAVYARFSPSEKGFLIKALQESRSCVGFCGDGSNDILALRNADIGLSFSSKEASLASPFSTGQKCLSCVLGLIILCKSSLCTCFACFYFMIFYAFIQASSLLVCHMFDTEITSWQYLYQDLWIIIPLAMTMAKAKASEDMVDKKPKASLLDRRVIWNLIIYCSFWTVLLQIIVLCVWNEKPGIAEKQDVNFINSVQFLIIQVIFYFSNCYIIILAHAFAVKEPFQQALLENSIFLINVSLVSLVHLIILLFPASLPVKLAIDLGLWQKLYIWTSFGGIFIVVQLAKLYIDVN